MFGDAGGAQLGDIMYDHSDNHMRFRVNNEERMRIDSGNLLVGTTDTTVYDNNTETTADNGLNLRGDGKLDAARYNGIVLGLNLTGNDGTLAEFRKNGASVGSIGATSSNLTISSSASGRSGLYFGSGAIFPMNGGSLDGADQVSIGSPNYQFANLYLSGGTLTGAFSSTGASAGKSVLASGRLTESSTGATTSKVHRSFYNPNGQVGTITTSGSATAYNTSSDYRLKTDAQPMTGATDRIKQLNPVNFEWIADGTRVDGFLAHEAQAVVPEAVTGAKDAMRDEEYEVTPAVTDDDGNVTTEAVMGTRSVPDYQGIDQSKLVQLLVATIKELEARTTALENA